MNSTKITELEGSTQVLVKIVLSAEKHGSFSKLFLQSAAARKVDCPLDINFRLKVLYPELTPTEALEDECKGARGQSPGLLSDADSCCVFSCCSLFRV